VTFVEDLTGATGMAAAVPASKIDAAAEMKSIFVMVTLLSCCDNRLWRSEFP
jgi:hypothetical protein